MPANAPPRQLLVSAFQPLILTFILRVIFVLRAVQGAIPTSWFRTFDENVSEGGDPESQHLFALAVDLDVGRGSVARVLEVSRAVGLVAVDERTHVHLQLFPRGALARAGVLFPGG